MKKPIFLLLFIFSVVFYAHAQENYDEVFFNNGKKLIESKRFFEAAKEFDNAISINPTAKYYFHKGVALRLDRKLKEAAEAYENSILLDAKNVRAYKDLARCYVGLRNHKKLVETWDEIFKNIPDSQEKLGSKRNIINFLIKQRSYEEALHHGKEAKKNFPSDVDILHLYAKINNELKNYKDAKANAERAAKLLATNDIKQVSKVYYELGYAAHFLGDFDTKNTAFEQVKEPSYKPLMARLTPQYFTSLATSFNAIFEYEKAKKHLSRAVEVDEHNPEANKLKAIIYGYQSSKEKPISFYKKGITGVLKKKTSEESDRYDQELLQDYSRLIEMELKAKDYKSAIVSADECLQLFAQQPLATENIKFYKAIALDKNEQTDEGIDILKDISESSKQNRSVNFLKYNFALGNMYFKQKAYEKAKQSFANSRRGPFANASWFMYEQIIAAEDAKKLAETAEE